MHAHTFILHLIFHSLNMISTYAWGNIVLLYVYVHILQLNLLEEGLEIEVNICMVVTKKNLKHEILKLEVWSKKVIYFLFWDTNNVLSLHIQKKRNINEK